MSRYLIQRIAAISNIEVMVETEIVALEGSPELGLEGVRWRSRRNDAEITTSIANVFLYLGADPATSWLASCGVALDKHGFVITDTGGSPLASSVPGVFAVGDVRLGSVERVGGAIHRLPAMRPTSMPPCIWRLAPVARLGRPAPASGLMPTRAPCGIS